jgi:hypothetical protein
LKAALKDIENHGAAGPAVLSHHNIRRGTAGEKNNITASGSKARLIHCDNERLKKTPLSMFAAKKL